MRRLRFFMKFSLLPLKLIVMFMTVTTCILGFYLFFTCLSVRNNWANKAEMFPGEFSWGATCGLVLGGLIVIISGFGLLMVCAKKEIAVLIYFALLSGVTIALLIIGTTLWMEVKSLHSNTVARLEGFTNGLSPRQLDIIQRKFKCCGIEKYLDYVLLWSIYAYDKWLHDSTGQKVVEHSPRPEMRVRKVYERSRKFAGQQLIEQDEKSIRIPINQGDLPEPPEARGRSRSQWKTPRLLFKSPINVWSRSRGLMINITEPPETFQVEDKIQSRHRVNILPRFQEAEGEYGGGGGNSNFTSFEIKNLVMDTAAARPPRKGDKDLLYKQLKDSKGNFLMLYNAILMDDSVNENTLLVQLQNFYEHMYDLVPNITHDKVMVLLPNMFRDAFVFFISYLNELTRAAVSSRVEKLTAWWWGEGWDRVLMQALVPTYTETALPFSCCRNPSLPCHGHFSDTFTEGCRPTIIWVFTQQNFEISMFMLVLVPLMMINAHTTFVYWGGLRGYFYF